MDDCTTEKASLQRISGLCVSLCEEITKHENRKRHIWKSIKECLGPKYKTSMNPKLQKIVEIEYSVSIIIKFLNKTSNNPEIYNNEDFGYKLDSLLVNLDKHQGIYADIMKVQAAKLRDALKLPQPMEVNCNVPNEDAGKGKGIWKILRDYVDKNVDGKYELFLGVGEWVLKFALAFGTVIAYVINKMLYCYDVGYFNLGLKVPLQYIQSTSGFSDYVIKALAATILILLGGSLLVSRVIPIYKVRKQIIYSIWRNKVHLGIAIFLWFFAVLYKTCQEYEFFGVSEEPPWLFILLLVLQSLYLIPGLLPVVIWNIPEEFLALWKKMAYGALGIGYSLLVIFSNSSGDTFMKMLLNLLDMKVLLLAEWLLPLLIFMFVIVMTLAFWLFSNEAQKTSSKNTLIIPICFLCFIFFLYYSMGLTSMKYAGEDAFTAKSHDLRVFSIAENKEQTYVVVYETEDRMIAFACIVNEEEKTITKLDDDSHIIISGENVVFTSYQYTPPQDTTDQSP